MFGDYANGPRKSKLLWQPTMLALLCLGSPSSTTYHSAKHTSRHFEFETGISEQGTPRLLLLARTATAGCATCRCLFLLVLPYVHVNVSTLRLCRINKGTPVRLSPVYITRVTL